MHTSQLLEMFNERNWKILDPVLFAVQFTLLHGCWLINDPLEGGRDWPDGWHTSNTLGIDIQAANTILLRFYFFGVTKFQSAAAHWPDT